MHKTAITIETENLQYARFADRLPVSIERGEGVWVWDEEGKKFLDFTAGWGVTCIGHASPVIADALAAQAMKIIQSPNAGAVYSPARARLLRLMREILPAHLTRVFFTNSGAEANDAAIKLARKASGKSTVIAALNGFHGRTIGAVSATGQAAHRDRFNPLLPDFSFVPYGDAGAICNAITDDTAAVLLEPVQGEGGVIAPPDGYLAAVSAICRERGVYLIVDEIQTGFCRTGPFFASALPGVRADFMTMAKGIAGGFPFGAFAFTDEVAALLGRGDHGGTYCGNPLGCAVSHAVISYLLANDIPRRVVRTGAEALAEMQKWKAEHPGRIVDVRGAGLLLALEFSDAVFTRSVRDRCLGDGLMLNVTHGTVVRVFPALTITAEEMRLGLGILKNVLNQLEPVETEYVRS